MVEKIGQLMQYENTLCPPIKATQLCEFSSWSSFVCLALSCFFVNLNQSFVFFIKNIAFEAAVIYVVHGSDIRYTFVDKVQNKELFQVVRLFQASDQL